MSTTLNYYYRYHILLLLTPRERALHGKLSSRNLEDFCWLLNLNAHHKIVKCLINVLLVVFVQNKTILIYGHIIMQISQLQNVSKGDWVNKGDHKIETPVCGWGFDRLFGYIIYNRVVC